MQGWIQRGQIQRTQPLSARFRQSHTHTHTHNILRNKGLGPRRPRLIETTEIPERGPKAFTKAPADRARKVRIRFLFLGRCRGAPQDTPLLCACEPAVQSFLHVSPRGSVVPGRTTHSTCTAHNTFIFSPGGSNLHITMDMHDLHCENSTCAASAIFTLFWSTVMQGWNGLKGRTVCTGLSRHSTGGVKDLIHSGCVKRGVPVQVNGPLHCGATTKGRFD